MAKSDPTERALAQIAALRVGGPAALAAELPKYLASKTNLVVAKAADLVREKRIESVVPHLVDAFPRFMHHPTTTDKGCAAKQAIANALYELGADAQELFLTGIRHVQKEAAWGQSVDTAAELRGLCALGLVRMGYRDVMVELVDLLVDESHAARIVAARAIAYAGRDEGALILRLKIGVGDREDVVTAECLLALGNLSRTRALPFIREYLDHANPTLAEAAAMALGEMRDSAALEVLVDRWEHSAVAEARQALALPIALSRMPQSVEFLFAAVAGESESVAGKVIEALRIYRHDAALTERLRAAVAARSSPELTRAFRVAFDA